MHDKTKFKVGKWHENENNMHTLHGTYIHACTLPSSWFTSVNLDNNQDACITFLITSFVDTISKSINSAFFQSQTFQTLKENKANHWIKIVLKWIW